MMTEHTNSPRISRRTILIGAAGAVPLLALGATSVQAAKLSQTAARYQDSPKGDKKCSNCNLFLPPNACKSVDGTISPNGWCALWVKKAG